MVAPGSFTVELATFRDGDFTTLTSAVPFEVVAIGRHTLPQPDREAVLAFHREAGELQRQVMGADQALSEAMDRVAAMKNVVMRDPAGTPELRDEIRALELRLMDLDEVLNGDPTRPRRQEPAMPGITDRIGTAVGGSLGASYGPTETHREQLEIARDQWEGVRDELETAVEVSVPAMADRLESMGFRWTPGMGVPGGR